ncbi:hypothetical protein D9M70_573430 [compost metagenome]
MKERQRALAESFVPTAGGQQAIDFRGIDGTPKVPANGTGTTLDGVGTGEFIGQGIFTAAVQRFEVVQTIQGLLGVLAGAKLHCHPRGASDGALQQALVDVADLLHVQCTVGQSSTLVLLDGFQQEQHSAVVDGQRSSDIDLPVRTLGSAFQEGETIRVEQ